MSTPHGHSVVVGIDGSDTSTSAALWGAEVASKWETPLSLVHVLPREGPLYHANQYSPAAAGTMEERAPGEIREDGEAIIDKSRKMLEQQFPKLDIDITITPGSGGKNLLAAAERARLIVLGSTGSGTIRSALVGSTALHVANHAKCPVVVLRGESGPPDQRPVVVGLDGSDLSREAANHAFEFASFFDAPLICVHTWQGNPTLGSGTRKLMMDWEAMKEEEVALLSESLAGESEMYPDVPVTRVAEQSAPATALMKHAEGGQLIVVGSHGRGRVLGALMGSTSQNLLHHAHCPVMICRREHH
ncbi:universal stress protein [Rhodococcus sp. NPDC049939]|uniref:universal stress protein n=1 Tax=Rhodococcus sp. NPDC049939 TaxID=3155511 RepID=UPI0033CE711E